MKKQFLILAAIACASVACRGQIGLDNEEPSLLSNAGEPGPNAATVDKTEPEQSPSPGETATQEPTVVVEIPDFSGAQLVDYMRGVAQILISRPLNQEEAARIESEKLDALEPILREWSRLPAFAESARFMMQQKLKASGERDDIDFELPGNLVRHVVANDLPWSTILTADYCIGNDGAEVPCDTGAPYNAGVLATRAFMAGNASRFNLGRASRLMDVFACRIYPMEDTLQPYLEREKLIVMFQADNAEEQQVEEAKGAFGNGDGCYGCHGQFGAHAQLFVKYAENGTYVADADGQQDPSGELGRSVNGLMTSHMIDPTQASSEQTQMFGQQVDDLSGAAAVLAQSPAFLPCQLGNFVHHAFGLSESAGVDQLMLRAIAERVAAQNADPTFADLAVAVLTDPRVILSAVGTEGETQ